MIKYQIWLQLALGAGNIRAKTAIEYFGDAEILGWFLTHAGQALEVNHNILKIHQKLFSREKSIFVVKEAREKEEKYFVHKYRQYSNSYIRFDVIVVDMPGLPDIYHIENAFSEFL